MTSLTSRARRPRPSRCAAAAGDVLCRTAHRSSQEQAQSDSVRLLLTDYYGLSADAEAAQREKDKQEEALEAKEVRCASARGPRCCAQMSAQAAEHSALGPSTTAAEDAPSKPARCVVRSGTVGRSSPAGARVACSAADKLSMDSRFFDVDQYVIRLLQDQPMKYVARAS